jgi:hypothetical protein
MLLHGSISGQTHLLYGAACCATMAIDPIIDFTDTPPQTVATPLPPLRQPPQAMVLPPQLPPLPLLTPATPVTT